MSAQKRSISRNYIDLVEHGDDERRAAERQAASAHPIRDYLRGLVAAVRSARSQAH